VAEFTIERQAALGGLREEVGATTLAEIDGARLTTLSLPRDREGETLQALEERLGCAMPEVGSTAVSPATGAQILRSGADRLMILMLPESGGGSEEAGALAPNLGYQVDQSDFWVVLELSGPLAVASLERTCRLDLHEGVFTPGTMARTPMEGVSTILVRLAADRFLLMAPRSFARALAHTLSTSLRYVAA
jgi:sarcosine oxidase subunit gamma